MEQELIMVKEGALYESEDGKTTFSIIGKLNPAQLLVVGKHPVHGPHWNASVEPFQVWVQGILAHAQAEPMPNRVTYRRMDMDLMQQRCYELARLIKLEGREDLIKARYGLETESVRRIVMTEAMNHHVRKIGGPPPF
jgi:hypothetical protein